MSTMSANRGRHISEGTQLLHLASACDRQQASHGELAIAAAIAEHYLAPLHSGTQGAFGAVIRRLDPLMMHEDNELLTVHEERRRQIAHVFHLAVQMPLAQREELSCVWRLPRSVDICGVLARRFPDGRVRAALMHHAVLTMSARTA
jgi:hypothetical protein